MTPTSDTVLTQFGFAADIGSAHLARSYMLDELQALLHYVAQSRAPAAPSIRPPSLKTTASANAQARRASSPSGTCLDLYALDPAVPIFRTLRYFWSRDAAAQPLLALLCACARDPLLRQTADVHSEAAGGRRRAAQRHGGLPGADLP